MFLCQDENETSAPPSEDLVVKVAPVKIRDLHQFDCSEAAGVKMLQDEKHQFFFSVLLVSLLFPFFL